MGKRTLRTEQTHMSDLKKSFMKVYTLDIPLWKKVFFLLWVFFVVALHFLFFGPPEFWSIFGRLGLNDLFQGVIAWLQSFFTAGYLS